ncbi:MAG: nuclear transport factor 2 family protein [Nitrospiria bacterium]
MSDTITEASLAASDVTAVEEANTAFYEAFESLDIQKMDALWVQEAQVKCVHPGWEICQGWPDVRDSWVLIFNHTHEIKFTIDVIDVTVHDDLAWAVCSETISTKDNGKWLEGHVLSTNLFERRGGTWLLIHHHGSPVISTGKEGEEEDTGNPTH